jgi:RHS repeat-associated protein
LNLFYGADGIRHKSILQQNGNTVKTTCFVGDLYEKETVDGVTRHLNYIYAGGQIVAINIQQDNTDNMYYVHTDHLGNYNVITDQNKTVCQRFHFDPWGNRTQYRSWHLPDNTAMPITTRGFTGHEHLSEFNIINMKGRLYDPVIARFFSPDPFVQAPEFTQGFNRYSYCLNNPLKYIDPTGELFTKFLDKDGNVIMDVDDGSNAVFQVTGTDATKDYFKFIGWDDQSGVNKINLSGLIAGSQDYVMNSFTKCNQAVNFVGRTYNAVLEQMGTRAESGYIVNQNFLANEISQQLLNSQIFSYEKTEEGIKSAQVAAEAGNLVIGTASGHVNMLTTGTFNITRYQNGTTTTFSYQSGQVANVNGRTTTSIGPDKNLGPNQNNSYYPIKNSHITALYPIYREIRVRFLLPTIFVYP